MARTSGQIVAAFVVALLGGAILAACGPGRGDTAQATGFVTASSPGQEGGTDSRGDGVLRDSNGRPFRYRLLGQVLPDFTAPTSEGGDFSPSRIDRWTILAVWGAWCGDCVADGPHKQALFRAVSADPDLDFVSIHVPASRHRAGPEEMFGRYGSLQAYFRAAGYEIPSIVLDQDGSLRETLQIDWTPTYLLVSPDGVVRGFRTDLSAAGADPVSNFLADIAQVRAETRHQLSGHRQASR